MQGESETRLKQTVRRLFLKAQGSDRTGTGRLEKEPFVDISPACSFGALMEQRLKDLEGNIREVKGRINGLIFLLIGVVLLEVIMRLVG